MFSSISSFFRRSRRFRHFCQGGGNVAFDPFYSDFRMGFWVWCAGCGDSGTKGWRAVWCDKDGKRARREWWGLGARFPALWDWHLSILQCQGSDHLFFFRLRNSKNWIPSADSLLGFCFGPRGKRQEQGLILLGGGGTSLERIRDWLIFTHHFFQWFSPINILPLSANFCLSFHVGSFASSYHVLLQRSDKLMLSNSGIFDQHLLTPSRPSSSPPPLCLCHALLFCHICFYGRWFLFWRSGNPLLSFTGTMGLFCLICETYFKCRCVPKAGSTTHLLSAT